MVSCVASVEVQLRVVESPLLMEVGLACSETVGFTAGGGAGAGAGGGAAGGFLAHPAAKARASMEVRMAPRYKELETRIIRILLSVRIPSIPCTSHQRHHPITRGLGKGKYIVSRYITHRTQANTTENQKKQEQLPGNAKVCQPQLVMLAKGGKFRLIYHRPNGCGICFFT